MTCDALASRPGGVEIHMAASCYRNRNKLQQNEPVLASRLHSKLQLRVFLASNTVAMVTYCVMKKVTTCSLMVGQFSDTMIVASSDKACL